MKASQGQFLVKVSGVDGYFATKSGGGISSDMTKVYDGGAIDPDVITGRATAENVTVSRPYDLDRDNALLTQLRPKVGRWRTTLSVTPTNEDLIATGTPTVYPDAMLIGITEPEANAGGSDAATFELEFAIGSFR